MKDIKIKVTNKLCTDNIITHALNIGYHVELSNVNNLYEADYIILDPNQSMRWCDKDIFDSSLDYELMTSEQFLEYREG